MTKKRLVQIIVLLMTVSALGLGCRNVTGSIGEASDEIVKPAVARPVLTYTDLITKGSPPFSSLEVMDADGAHPSALLRSDDTSTYFENPNWSPSGKSICFLQSGSGIRPDTLKAVDLGIGTNGELVGKNLRTIVACSLPGSVHVSPGPYGQTIGYPRWSSTAKMGKIAYSVTEGDVISLRVIAETGGTPQVIWSGGASEIYPYCAWSPDDSRLAVARIDGGYGKNIIMLFNTSTWKCEDSVAVSGMLYGLDWSRDGMNKLAFGRAATLNGPSYISYCDPKRGSVTTTNGVPGWDPCWAPDNSSLVYGGDAGVMQLGYYSHKATTLHTGATSSACWKR